MNLTLYDTKTNQSLSNSVNTITQETCNSFNLCIKIIQVNFQFQDNSFDNLNSLTCSAFSKNNNVPLTISLQLNVSLTIIGILIIHLEFIEVIFFQCELTNYKCVRDVVLI